jgi:hypothetical protein
MATIVNTNEFSKRFVTLGWDQQINLSELIEGMKSNNISASAVIAYLDALIATPIGLNDQTIIGCSAATATKITTYLVGKGVEAS